MFRSFAATGALAMLVACGQPAPQGSKPEQQEPSEAFRSTCVSRMATGSGSPSARG